MMHVQLFAKMDPITEDSVCMSNHYGVAPPPTLTFKYPSCSCADRDIFIDFILPFFSRSILSNSLRPHGLQHARIPCPSPSPRACSNSCPLSQWCHLTLCCPLLLLPSIFPSLRVFSNELALCISWPKYYRFSLSPSNEYSGLISFRINWFDLFSVQGTLKSLLQHHSSKTSIIWCSPFLMVQLAHLYMTTGKTSALITQTFVGKVMSLLFNMLSKFVIAFLFRTSGAGTLSLHFSRAQLLPLALS